MTRRRLRALALALTVLALASLGVVLDATQRGAIDHGAIDDFVRRTGSSELALSTSSRWLRHPAAAEPGAGCQDQPPCFDVDPAGLAIAPPRMLFGRAVSIEAERVAP